MASSRIDYLLQCRYEKDSAWKPNLRGLYNYNFYSIGNLSINDLSCPAMSKKFELATW